MLSNILTSHAWCTDDENKITHKEGVDMSSLGGDARLQSSTINLLRHRISHNRRKVNTAKIMFLITQDVPVNSKLFWSY